MTQGEGLGIDETLSLEISFCDGWGGMLCAPRSIIRLSTHWALTDSFADAHCCILKWKPQKRNGNQFRRSCQKVNKKKKEPKHHLGTSIAPARTRRKEVALSARLGKWINQKCGKLAHSRTTRMMSADIPTLHSWFGCDSCDLRSDGAKTWSWWN